MAALTGAVASKSEILGADEQSTHKYFIANLAMTLVLCISNRFGFVGQYYCPSCLMFLKTWLSSSL